MSKQSKSAVGVNEISAEVLHPADDESRQIAAAATSRNDIFMKYKLVLWDFDGTLADTLSVALDVYNQLAAKKGFKPVDDPFAVRDMSMSEFLKSHGIPAHRVPFAFSAFLKQVRSQASDVSLMDGVAELVPKISELGLQQGVISSNSTDNIQQCLTANHIARHFQFLKGTSRIFGKESTIRATIKQAGLVAEQVLYVGDEIRDIDAARAAGVDIACVTWGLNSAKALLRHNPDHVVANAGDLLDILA